jgi:hypothetical protein
VNIKKEQEKRVMAAPIGYLLNAAQTLILQGVEGAKNRRFYQTNPFWIFPKIVPSGS